MLPHLTSRGGRPGRATALAFGVLVALAPLAQAATPSPTPTPTPGTAASPAAAEDAKLNAIFQHFDAKRDAVEGTLRSLEGELVAVEDQLSRLREVLATSEAELAKRGAELDAATKRVAHQRSLIRTSAAQLYMRGPWSYINTVLNAQDISSITRADVYSEWVVGDFVHTLHEVETQKQDATKLYTGVRARTLGLRAQAAAMESRESAIIQRQQRAFSRRQGLINELIADFGGIAELKKHGFDIIIRSFSGSSDRITSVVQQAQKGEDVAVQGTYLLSWPVTEHRVTSRFGWRIHPIFGYRSFHTGIDIGSDYGSPITAALGGRVISVGYMGAFGLVVVMDNGHSIATVYAHMSRATVHTGQIVQSGDKLGEVGCSGWCTGPHVHFEVRLASKPDNPVFWL
jgi:murein DD-endopeptidase MepM/ murein hydrolase activator NlpD